VAYAENFRGGVHSVTYGGHLCLVCAVYDVTIWPHIHVSKPTFGEVCQQYAYPSTCTPLFYVSLHWISTISAPS